jgi:hypothetical protein
LHADAPYRKKAYILQYSKSLIVDLCMLLQKALFWRNWVIFSIFFYNRLIYSHPMTDTHTVHSLPTRVKLHLIKMIIK